jgi:hypothetical protein
LIQNRARAYPKAGIIARKFCDPATPGLSLSATPDIIDRCGADEKKPQGEPCGFGFASLTSYSMSERQRDPT